MVMNEIPDMRQSYIEGISSLQIHCIGKDSCRKSKRTRAIAIEDVRREVKVLLELVGNDNLVTIKMHMKIMRHARNKPFGPKETSREIPRIQEMGCMIYVFDLFFLLKLSL
ncbi:hypothetical protein M8C21_019848 [Ambrosia artemisiifolia]|uniref:Uncharacterized protein n=1 Tax=Ambrosia artemisiifolia TaxID=4212 RepID=A0AAD5GBS4_AMBAR|nr:hypothetical protein M8C21_019848 [Ambrosia artemisiifolia]